jgi:DNA mismatch repair protein MutL
LRVIDQHAAHERVTYERLVKDYAGAKSLSQPLLVPASAEYPPDQAIAIAERMELLRAVGVDIEPFGGSTFLVRAIPAAIAGSDWRAVIWAMVDAVISNEGMEAPDPPHRLLATVACHAAIKARQRLDDDAMMALVRDWIATPRNATCPHGRPVALTWAPSDLERALGRRA